jgi:hypothetical protein
MSTNGEAAAAVRREAHRLSGGPLDGMAVADIPLGRSEHVVDGKRIIVERTENHIAVVKEEPDAG